MFLLATITSIIYLNLARGIYAALEERRHIAIIFGILLLGSEITSALGTYELYWGKSHVSKRWSSSCQRFRPPGIRMWTC